MEAKQANALAIIAREAEELRHVRTNSAMLALQANAAGRNYDYSQFEYNLQSPHMRRSQRVPGYKARFNNIGLLRRAFDSPGLTEAVLSTGTFTANATRRDLDHPEGLRLPVQVKVIGMDTHNSVDFRDMFDAFCEAVFDLKAEMDENPHIRLKITPDMHTYALRNLLNRALTCLTMTSDEALDCLERTGFYSFETAIQTGSFSTFGFDKYAMLYLFVYSFVKNMHPSRSGVSRRHIPALLVFKAEAGDNEAFLTRLQNCVRIFGDPSQLLNLTSVSRANRDYVAMRFRPDQKFWTQHQLDALRFFAMYLFLNNEVHQFLGNDEITANLCLVIHWMVSHPESRRLVLKYGFYRLLVRYVSGASAIPLPFRTVKYQGVIYTAFPYDCFQMERMCKLVPQGLGELWVGTLLVQRYPNGLPRDGKIPEFPIPEIDGRQPAGNACLPIHPDTLDLARLSFQN